MSTLNIVKLQRVIRLYATKCWILSTEGFQPRTPWSKVLSTYQLGMQMFPLYVWLALAGTIHFHMGQAMRKRVIEYMWTVKAQISLCICVGWSGPSLSTNRIIGYYRMYEQRTKARMILCACAGWCESMHFAYAWWQFFARRGP